LKGFGVEFLSEAAFAVEGWGFEIWIPLQALPLNIEFWDHQRLDFSTFPKRSVGPNLFYRCTHQDLSSWCFPFFSVLFKLRHPAYNFPSGCQAPRLRRCRTLVLDTIGHATTFPE
jgi:hypothetical protein